MSVTPGRKTLQLSMDETERQRIRTAAQMRELDDSILVRLIVAGALNQGGGTLEKLISLGENAISSPVRRRAGRDFANLWVLVGEQTYEWGGWSLVKMTVKQDTRGGEDQAKWWHLTSSENHHLMVPIAFKREEAMRLAVEMIEQGRVPT